MKRKVVDTNVIIRFLVGDNLAQKKLAEDYFKQAEQEMLELIIYPIVVAEVCFVLQSVYKESRVDIVSSMQVLLSQRWLEVVDRSVLLGLWDNYLQGFHFVDSYLLSTLNEQKAELLSFDKKAIKRAEG